MSAEMDRGRGAPAGGPGAGPRRDVTRVAGAEELAATLAARYVDAAREAVTRHGTFRVALAGGRTPEQAYALLARWTGGALPWERTEVFWGDERPVPPDHPDSNYRMAHEALLSRVPVRAANVHRLHGEAPDLEAAASEYALELADAFGIPAAGPPPRFDLVLLGMGPEGHTASLFPGSPVLGSHAWVAAPFVPELGMSRLTLTPWVLNAADRVVFAVGGTNKAAALRAVLHGPRAPRQFPAQAIAPARRPAEWLIDTALAEAAGLRP